MDRQIEILNMADSKDNYGDNSPIASVIHTVWTEKVVLSGRELWAAQQINPRITVRYRIRFLEGIIPKMVVRDDGTDFDILHVGEIGRREKTEIHASARNE